MNKQTVEGKLDQVAGKIKEKFGEATGNGIDSRAGSRFPNSAGACLLVILSAHD